MKIKSVIAYHYFMAAFMILPSTQLSQAGTSGASGSITTDRGIVLPETIVNVDWEATYPVRPINREPSGTLNILTETRIEVRVIAAALGSTSRPQPARCWVKTSGGDWNLIFLGNSNTVNPQTVVWSRNMSPGEDLDFKFQFATDTDYDINNPSTIRNWQHVIDTTPSSLYPWNRRVLLDGEVVPQFTPAHDQEDLRTHLTGYFIPGTNRLSLGERDFIYLTELSPFEENFERTDMQDLVLLVTYTDVPASGSN